MLCFAGPWMSWRSSLFCQTLQGQRSCCSCRRSNATSFDEKIWQLDRNRLPWFWQVHVKPICNLPNCSINVAFKDLWVPNAVESQEVHATICNLCFISNWASIFAASRRGRDSTHRQKIPTHTERVLDVWFNKDPAFLASRNRCTWTHHTQRIQGALQTPENNNGKHGRLDHVRSPKHKQAIADCRWNNQLKRNFKGKLPNPCIRID